MKTPVSAFLVSMMMCVVTLSGCLHVDDGNKKIIDNNEINTGIFVTNSNGISIDLPPLPLNFIFSDVGEDGPEPSIGITSSGCIFFHSFRKTYAIL